ncbi:hypothetical protein G9A89_020867 [Geosiphon pyriformis]|nr:hypothetical protein G9A89_020867 [Geosiphon pyriformis]
MGSKNYFSLLPPETSGQIFEDLDTGSMFNCLLVERQWCCEIVPLLWSSPLGVGKPNNAIGTFAQCFSPEEWNCLREKKIFKPRTLQVATFDYPSYLRVLNEESLWLDAAMWMFPKAKDPTRLTKLQNQKQTALFQVLLKLFFRQSKVLSKISIEQSFVGETSFWMEVRAPVKEIFKNLTHFESSTFQGFPYLIGILSETCRNIQHLYFKNADFRFGGYYVCGTIPDFKQIRELHQLIKLQKQILSFSIVENIENGNVDLLNNTISTIKGTLRSLSIRDIRLPTLIERLYPNLASFSNLRCLDLEVIASTLELNLNLITAEFSLENLECLRLCSLPAAVFELVSSFFTSVIRAAQKSLKFLSLSNGNISWEELSLDLTFLEIGDTNETKLLTLLKCLPKLERLYILGYVSRGSQFDTLWPSFPSSLRVFQIKHRYTLGIYKPFFTLKILQNFLTNSPNQFERLYLGNPFAATERTLLQWDNIELSCHQYGMHGI